MTMLYKYVSVQDIKLKLGKDVDRMLIHEKELYINLLLKILVIKRQNKGLVCFVWTDTYSLAGRYFSFIRLIRLMWENLPLDFYYLPYIWRKMYVNAI